MCDDPHFYVYDNNILHYKFEKFCLFCIQFSTARQTVNFIDDQLGAIHYRVFRPLYLGLFSMVGPQWGQPLWVDS